MVGEAGAALEAFGSPVLRPMVFFATASDFGASPHIEEKGGR